MTRANIDIVVDSIALNLILGGALAVLVLALFLGI